MLEDYERILPGSADRIISMAEREQIHRLKQEVRGWLSGFVIVILTLSVSALALFLGQNLAGFALVLIATSGLIANFMNFLTTRKSPPEPRDRPES